MRKRTADIIRPARYDDLLRIRTRVSEARRRTISFAYEILRDDGAELLATGETVHIICNREGRPKSLPEKYRQYFPLTARREVVTRDSETGIDPSSKQPHS